MTEHANHLLSQFLGEELSAAENTSDQSLFEVICCGLEKPFLMAQARAQDRRPLSPPAISWNA